MKLIVRTVAKAYGHIVLQGFNLKIGSGSGVGPDCKLLNVSPGALDARPTFTHVTGD